MRKSRFPRNPNYLDDLIITPDGGMELNMKNFLKRPEVQRRIRVVGRIAKRKIAERHERLKREQEQKNNAGK